jgi:hypothetical protein
LTNSNHPLQGPIRNNVARFRVQRFKGSKVKDKALGIKRQASGKDKIDFNDLA